MRSNCPRLPSSSARSTRSRAFFGAPCTVSAVLALGSRCGTVVFIGAVSCSRPRASSVRGCGLLRNHTARFQRLLLLLESTGTKHRDRPIFRSREAAEVPGGSNGTDRFSGVRRAERRFWEIATVSWGLRVVGGARMASTEHFSAHRRCFLQRLPAKSKPHRKVRRTQRDTQW